MKKVNVMEMRNVDGGRQYFCRDCRKWVGFNSFTVGWHSVFSHGGRGFRLSYI